MAVQITRNIHKAGDIAGCNSCLRKTYRRTREGEFLAGELDALHEVRIIHNAHQASAFDLCGDCLVSLVAQGADVIADEVSAQLDAWRRDGDGVPTTATPAA